MKTTRVLLMAFLLVFAYACSSDDDGTATTKCYQCDTNLSGNQSDTIYCDNGNGTMEVTTIGSGKVQTVSLQGNTFEEYIASVRANSGTCSVQ